LKEDQFRILKTMNEATNRMDLTMFAQAVNLNQNQAISEVQELAKEGFLRKVGGGFGLTEKGKNAIKAYVFRRIWVLTFTLMLISRWVSQRCRLMNSTEQLSRYVLTLWNFIFIGAILRSGYKKSVKTKIWLNRSEPQKWRS
jgi:predicted transcriptional regulator